MTTLTDTVPVPAGTALLEIMDKGGDTKLRWDPSNPDEVENARRTFNELKAKNFMAFSVEGTKGNRRQGSVLQAFDATAERVIMTPPMAGG